MSPRTSLACVALLSVVACGDSGVYEPPDRPRPPFEGTVWIDPAVLTLQDPTTLTELTYVGQAERTMYDRRVDDQVTVDAYLFSASYDDGFTIEVQVNPEFDTPETAQVDAQLYAHSFGLLPAGLRQEVERIWIHRGFELFSGFDGSILVHTQQGNAYRRDGFLEEVLLHEAAHVSLDPEHASAPGWLAARSADPTFISTYARSFPQREDIAESYAAYFAVRYRADRISEWTRSTIVATIPNRIAYFDALGLDMHPIE